MEYYVRELIAATQRITECLEASDQPKVIGNQSQCRFSCSALSLTSSSPVSPSRREQPLCTGRTLGGIVPSWPPCL